MDNSQHATHTINDGEDEKIMLLRDKVNCFKTIVVPKILWIEVIGVSTMTFWLGIIGSSLVLKPHVGIFLGLQNSSKPIT